MLAALIVDPRWIEIATKPSIPASAPSVPGPTAVAARPVLAAPAAPAAKPMERPAHLNLDVRHSFRKVDLTVTVDGKRALQTSLEGSGKKFGVFGKRAERGYTHTLDLAPGVRVVRVRLQSAADKFDQTRVERFELPSASVASLSITAEKSGLSLVADRPQLPAPAPPAPLAASVAPVAIAPAALPVQPQPATPQAADVFITEVFKTLRSVLIAVAGFIASAATGFVVQEFLRMKKSVIFHEAEANRRRRRRPAVPALPAE